MNVMIWLVGNKGMLGTEISRQLEEKGIDFTGTDREVDFTDFSAVENFVREKKIGFIINCAAYTAVDRAESDGELAEKLNVEGPKNLARVSEKIGATLIHISTDYVFDGNAKTPRTEDMEVCPIGVYGRTKADGEKAVSENCARHYILRTAWLYGWAGKNFVYTMIKAMNTHDSVKVVNDQKGTPTFACNLAQVILMLVSAKNVSGLDSNIPYGIYHCTDLGEISWWDFTNEIKRQGIEKGWITNAGCKVLPCSTSEYPTPAKRPAYSVLSKEKIQSALKMTLSDWKEGLSEFLSSPLFDRTKIEN